MANEIKVVFDPNQTDLWFVLRKDDSGTMKVRDVIAPAWDNWADNDIDDYDIALTEDGLGQYFGDTPSLSGWDDAEYPWVAYQGTKDTDAIAFSSGSVFVRNEVVVTKLMAMLIDLNLDHLMKIAVNDRDNMVEVTDNTVLANIMTKTDGDTSDFDPDLYSLEAVADSIIAGGSIIYVPTAGTVTTGDQGATTYAKCAVDDADRWEIGDEDGDNTINVIATMAMGNNRKAIGVTINGHFDENGSGSPVVEIYARDYTTPGNNDWNKLSAGTADTEMRNKASDQLYQFALSYQNTCTVDNGADVKGDVQIKFVSTRETTADGDILNLDYIGIAGISSGAVSPEIFADAVWITKLLNIRAIGSDHMIAGHLLKRLLALGTTVSAEDSTTSFTLTAGITEIDAYKGMLLEIRDESSTTRDIEIRKIISWTSERVVIVDRAFSFTPTTGDFAHILGVSYAEVDNVNQIINRLDADYLTDKTQDPWEVVKHLKNTPGTEYTRKKIYDSADQNIVDTVTPVAKMIEKV